jgi:ubiquinone/menaquinone biosynthesis C-methylase UbiE
MDRIICHDGFHHIPNQAEIISELARVLKPGGQEIRVQINDVGKFTISIDLVSEGICWFENMGSKPLYLRIDVH